MPNPTISSLTLPVKNPSTGEVTNVTYNLPSGGSGSGDMMASTYDPNGAVATAGGIADYVDDAIDTAITSALTASY